MGYSPWGHKELDMTEVTGRAHTHTHAHTHKHTLAPPHPRRPTATTHLGATRVVCVTALFISDYASCGP